MCAVGYFNCFIDGFCDGFGIDRESCACSDCWGKPDSCRLGTVCADDGSECEEINPPVGECDNGEVNSGETCENGMGFSGLVCKDFNEEFTGGSLSCVDCQISTAGCSGVPVGDCGNGVVNPGETCENGMFSGLWCGDFGDFKSGELDCYPRYHLFECKIDTSGCSDGPIPPGGYCGDGNLEYSEPLYLSSQLQNGGISLMVKRNKI